MIDAYPLCWPLERPKTPSHKREKSQFAMTFGRARDGLIKEIERMCGKYDWMKKETGLVISTNVALRRDGLPLANQREPSDPGVAVYFTYKKRQVCFACDRWNKVQDNIHAIAKTVEALRGIARWGSGDMLEAAFTGFAALPAPGRVRLWNEVLGVAAHAPTEEVKAAYRYLAKIHHPDSGGNHDQFTELNAAWQEFQKERGLA